MWQQEGSNVISLDGPNRQSPIAGVQRARSNSRRPFHSSMRNECCTNERQSRDSNRGTTNARAMRTNWTKREGVPEMGTKPLKALRGYRASNRGSNRGSKGSRKTPEALRG